MQQLLSHKRKAMFPGSTPHIMLDLDGFLRPTGDTSLAPLDMSKSFRDPQQPFFETTTPSRTVTVANSELTPTTPGPPGMGDLMQPNVQSISRTQTVIKKPISLPFFRHRDDRKRERAEKQESYVKKEEEPAMNGGKFTLPPSRILRSDATEAGYVVDSYDLRWLGYINSSSSAANHISVEMLQAVFVALETGATPAMTKTGVYSVALNQDGGSPISVGREVYTLIQGYWSSKRQVVGNTSLLLESQEHTFTPAQYSQGSDPGGCAFGVRDGTPIAWERRGGSASSPSDATTRAALRRRKESMLAYARSLVEVTRAVVDREELQLELTKLDVLAMAVMREEAQNGGESSTAESVRRRGSISCDPGEASGNLDRNPKLLLCEGLDWLAETSSNS